MVRISKLVFDGDYYISGHGHTWAKSVGCLEFSWAIVRY